MTFFLHTLLLIPVSMPRLSAHFQLFPAGWWPRPAYISLPPTAHPPTVSPRASLLVCLFCMSCACLFFAPVFFVLCFLPFSISFYMFTLSGWPVLAFLILFFCIFWAAIRMTFLLAHAFEREESHKLHLSFVKSSFPPCLCVPRILQRINFLACDPPESGSPAFNRRQ